MDPSLATAALDAAQLSAARGAPVSVSSQGEGDEAVPLGVGRNGDHQQRMVPVEPSDSHLSELATAEEACARWHEECTKWHQASHDLQNDKDRLQELVLKLQRDRDGLAQRLRTLEVKDIAPASSTSRFGYSFGNVGGQSEESLRPRLISASLVVSKADAKEDLPVQADDLMTKFDKMRQEMAGWHQDMKHQHEIVQQKNETIHRLEGLLQSQQAQTGILEQRLRESEEDRMEHTVFLQAELEQVREGSGQAGLPVLIGQRTGGTCMGIAPNHAWKPENFDSSFPEQTPHSMPLEKPAGSPVGEEAASQALRVCMTALERVFEADATSVSDDGHTPAAASANANSLTPAVHEGSCVISSARGVDNQAVEPPLRRLVALGAHTSNLIVPSPRAVLPHRSAIPSPRAVSPLRITILSPRVVSPRRSAVAMAAITPPWSTVQLTSAIPPSVLEPRSDPTARSLSPAAEWRRGVEAAANVRASAEHFADLRGRSANANSNSSPDGTAASPTTISPHAACKTTDIQPSFDWRFSRGTFSVSPADYSTAHDTSGVLVTPQPQVGRPTTQALQSASAPIGSQGSPGPMATRRVPSPRTRPVSGQGCCAHAPPFTMATQSFLASSSLQPQLTPRARSCSSRGMADRSILSAASVLTQRVVNTGIGGKASPSSPLMVCRTSLATGLYGGYAGVSRAVIPRSGTPQVPGQH